MIATDIYTSVGFVLPPLPREMQQKLRGFLSTDAGVSLNNPIDLAGQYYADTKAVYDVVKAMADYSDIDILVSHLPLGIVPFAHSFSKEFATSSMDNVIRAYNETSKPTAVVIDQLTIGESWETALTCQKKCHEARIPVYFFVDSAAKAINRFLRYHENRGNLIG